MKKYLLKNKQTKSKSEYFTDCVRVLTEWNNTSGAILGNYRHCMSHAQNLMEGTGG